MPPGEPVDPASFPKTRWSLIGRAAGPVTAISQAALGELVVRYIPALRAHLILARRISPDAADDLLQEFLTSKVLEQGLFGQALPGKGKFRTFLLAAMGNFLIDAHRAARAKKRTADGGTVPIHGENAPDTPDPRVEEPSAAFEAAWARQVMDRAATLMQQQCEADKKTGVWSVFEARLLAPWRDGSAPVEYEALIKTLGADSTEQVSNLLVTAKRTFNRSLRAAIAEYAGDNHVDQEIYELREALGRACPR